MKSASILLMGCIATTAVIMGGTLWPKRSQQEIGSIKTPVKTGQEYSEWDKTFIREKKEPAAKQSELISGPGRKKSTTGPEMEAVIIQMPVAFLPPDPSLFLEREQIQAIQSVQKSFRDAMSRAGSPSSPEYLDRWLAEQAKADELLMAYLGPEAFGKYHQPETE